MEGLKMARKKFDIQAWMQKVAEARQCARAVWRNGRVVEVVVR